MKYDVTKEYVNIENYSPFSRVNEISPQFQKNPFQLPFIQIFDEERPVHPDMFHDLRLDPRSVVRTTEVFPTSSFRTVYEPKKNTCYKLPVLRTITRSVRDLPYKELERSQLASKLLSGFEFKNFKFLDETIHRAPDPHFNFIERKMSEEDCFPWFYVISSRKFDKNFEIECASNMIRAWMFHASKGIIFESFHTQNILVCNDASIIYRDLSDVRTDRRDPNNSVLVPTYYDSLTRPEDLLSISFDRSFCNQNLDHLLRYDRTLGSKEIEEIKKVIREEIKKYALLFPDYSLDYSKDSPSRIPTKIPLTMWRN